jgi:hypothetical protein
MLQAGVAVAETAEEAETADAADQADAIDVCSLLAQLMLASGPPAQPAAAAVPDESAPAAPDEIAAVAPDAAAASDAALPAAAGNAVSGAASPGKPVFARDTAPSVSDTRPGSCGNGGRSPGAAGDPGPVR